MKVENMNNFLRFFMSFSYSLVLLQTFFILCTIDILYLLPHLKKREQCVALSLVDRKTFKIGKKPLCRKLVHFKSFPHSRNVTLLKMLAQLKQIALRQILINFCCILMGTLLVM